MVEEETGTPMILCAYYSVESKFKFYVFATDIYDHESKFRSCWIFCYYYVTLKILKLSPIPGIEPEPSG